MCDFYGDPVDDRKEEDPDHVSLHDVADQFNITVMKARRLMITGGMYSTVALRKVQALHEQGMTVAQITEKTELVYTGAAETETPALEERLEESPAEQENVSAKYTLTDKMNIRRAPSLDAPKLGVAEKGTVVEVKTIENDWLCLTNTVYQNAVNAVDANPGYAAFDDKGN